MRFKLFRLSTTCGNECRIGISVPMSGQIWNRSSSLRVRGLEVDCHDDSSAQKWVDRVGRAKPAGTWRHAYLSMFRACES